LHYIADCWQVYQQLLVPYRSFAFFSFSAAVNNLPTMKRFISPRNAAKKQRDKVGSSGGGKDMPLPITAPQLQPDRVEEAKHSSPTALTAANIAAVTNKLQPDRLFDTTDAIDEKKSTFVRRHTVSSHVSDEEELSLSPGASCCVSDELRHKISFLSEMILGYDLIVVLLASSALTFLVMYISTSEYSKWLSYVTASSPAVGTLGALFSFALVFRTNICYARWWEGRSLWGNIIILSIRICQQSRLWIHSEQLNDRIDCLAITFAYTCKAMLRGNSIDHEEEDGHELVRKGVLAPEELDVISNEAAWQPFYCIDALRAAVNEGLVRTEHEISYEGRKNAAHTAMEDTIVNLAAAVGGCIRVKSTGLPVAYDNILNAIGVIFFSAACLAWAPGAKYYNPILVLVIYIATKMIINVGNDMEDPFGFDESDL
jgi:putative membrane protein